MKIKIAEQHNITVLSYKGISISSYTNRREKMLKARVGETTTAYFTQRFTNLEIRKSSFPP